MVTAIEAKAELIDIRRQVTARINAFMLDAFICRGGRIGSGFGTVIEGLWGLYSNQVLRAKQAPIEIAWLGTNQYNDFAVVDALLGWDEGTKEGELLRIEAKSMNQGADEAKGHFDEIQRNLGADDLLLVPVWEWRRLDEHRVFPVVVDSFLGSARSVAQLRDVLHLSRGGTFVNAQDCPDQCVPSECTHAGEPLNARGTRERRFGPERSRGANTRNAANFGGLVRMLAVRSAVARAVLDRQVQADPVAKEYTQFVERNLSRGGRRLTATEATALDAIGAGD